MRHTFKLLAATVAAATICSCSTLTGYPTDAEASYAKAIEIAQKSVDTDKFKVYSLSFMEGETLSDNLFLISVKLVNRDNQAFSQSYYMTGLEPTALRDVQRTFEDPEYETTVGIDLTKLDAAQIAAQIAQAKAMEKLNSVKFAEAAKTEEIMGGQDLEKQSGREAGEIPRGDPS